MPITSATYCKMGKHEYRAGFCLNCFKLNTKLTEYEQAECTKLRDMLDERARKERRERAMK